MNEYFNCDKVIYQTYECEFSELHDMFKKTAQTWIDMHPDWVYHFSSAEKRKEEIVSILNLSKHQIEAYDSLNGVLQGDIWRFIMTAEYSGMYADLDSIPLSNVENVINKLDKAVDIIAPLEGYQIVGEGSNTSNYVFGKNTYLGKELIKIIYEFLEMSAYNIKTGKKPLNFNTMEIWPRFIVVHRDRVAQIYSDQYYIHGKGMKPPQEWRTKFESPRRGLSKFPCPGVYTIEWDSMYKKAKESLL